MQAVEVHNIGKRYLLLTPEESIGESEVSGAARHTLLKPKLKKEAFWALRNVSFSVPPASMLGIIGDNGSGKSTLLKLMAGITSPDEGDLHIEGRVASMLELGVGFHPDLSGMENIFLNGSVLGMSRREIATNLSRIIDFSGIGDFVYSPVKHYSTGMYARLGFSIAIHCNPDVLLIDEILAVGDAEFQLRCLEEIKHLRAAGKSIIIVSHSISLMEMVTEHVIWLDRGRIKAMGKPSEICRAYREFTAQRDKKEIHLSHPYFSALNKPQVSTSTILRSVKITDMHGNPQTSFNTGDAVRISIDYETDRQAKNPQLSVLFRYIEREVPVAEVSPDMTKEPLSTIPPKGRFVIELNPLLLVKGRYEVSVLLYNRLDSSELYDALIGCATITVDTPGEYLPNYLILKAPCRWQHIPAPSGDSPDETS